MYGSNTDLDDYKRQVREEARRIAASVPGADRYVRDFLTRIDAEEAVSTEVIVRVSVPVADQAEATNLVDEQASGLMLPAGWTVTVGGN